MIYGSIIDGIGNAVCGGVRMAVCYDRLWKLLIDKKMNRTELKEASGISFNVLARMGKNEPISLESIEKICFTLKCD
ncbi:MAG: helix-turn-helix transcriptional regulator, partial [Clostridiales bacterium]|nr:helix-turn-helix transcriptional regulator [Clostridiales bacterium]